MNSNIETFAKRLSSKIEQNEAVIFIGAGVSMVQPSNLPSGKELKEIVLETLLLSKFKKEIKALHKNKLYNEIIPEVLFSEMHLILQSNIFPIFEILKLTTPNKIHELLAKIYLQFGVPIFTTNFDLLVDSFLPKNSVHHLHGDLNDVSKIYIVLRQIIKGISQNDWEIHRKSIVNKELFILGYSGNDRDILQFIDKSGTLKVNWLIRTNDTYVSSNVKSMLIKNITLYEGDLNDINSLISSELPLLKNLHIKSNIQADMDITSNRMEIIDRYKTSISDYKISIVLMRVYHRLGMYKKSITIGKKLIKETNLNTEDYYRACILTSDILRLTKDGQTEALDIIDNILKDKKSENSYVFAEVLNGKAVILLNKANFNTPILSRSIISLLENALKYLERDKNLLDSDSHFKKERYKIMKSFIFQNIGLGFYYLNDFKTSKSFLLKSLKLKRNLNHLNGMISTYNSLAINEYATNGRYFSYWKSQAFELIDKYSLFKLKVEFHKELGILLIHKGELSKGLESLTSALSIVKTQLSESRHKTEITKLMSNAKNKKEIHRN